MSDWPGDWILPEWPAPSRVRACVTTREGGVSQAPFDSFNLGDHVGDAPNAVVANRQQLQRVLGCEPVAYEAAPGTGVCFRSELWHRTERASAGTVKLALFFGRRL